MTKEELKKKLEKKAEKECVLNDKIHRDCFVSGYLKGALPREKRIEELEQENNKLLDVINNQDVKIADLEKENKKLDRALITSTKNNIERQKIIDSLQAEKEKEKMQIIANCSDKEEGLRRKIFKLEQQIEKMKNCNNCKGYYTEQCLGCEDYCNWELKEIE